jgi:hypothetical protein
MSEMPAALKVLIMAMSGCDGDCDNCSVGEEETPVHEATLEDLVGMVRSIIKLQDLPKLTVQELVEVKELLDHIIPVSIFALVTRNKEVVRKLPYITLAIIELQERGLEYKPADTFLKLLYEIF